jgi:hypothetical protein
MRAPSVIALSGMRNATAVPTGIHVDRSWRVNAKFVVETVCELGFLTGKAAGALRTYVIPFITVPK